MERRVTPRLLVVGYFNRALLLLLVEAPAIVFRDAIFPTRRVREEPGLLICLSAFLMYVLYLSLCVYVVVYGIRWLFVSMGIVSVREAEGLPALRTFPESWMEDAPGGTLEQKWIVCGLVAALLVLSFLPMILVLLR